MIPKLSASLDPGPQMMKTVTVNGGGLGGTSLAYRTVCFVKVVSSSQFTETDINWQTAQNVCRPKSMTKRGKDVCFCFVQLPKVLYMRMTFKMPTFIMMVQKINVLKDILI